MSTSVTRNSNDQVRAGAVILSLLALAVSAAAGLAAPSFLEGECEGEFSLRAEVKVAGSVSGNASAELLYHYQDERNHCLLKVSRSSVSLATVQDGKTTVLGSAALRPSAGAHLLTLQRRQWRVNVVWDAKTVLSTYDGVSRGGKSGTQTLGSGFSIESPRYQPSDPVYFTDDFARAKSDAELWQGLAGKWGLQETKGEYSSNRFSWESRGDGEHLCASGYWFWDSYKCEVSAKSAGANSIGVAAYVQDKDNYLLARWTRRTAESAGERQLLLVRNGKRSVLASEAGGFWPNQWHTVRVAATGGRVHAAFDGHGQLSADCAAFGQGKLGLYAEGPAEFDDVRAEASDGFRETFSEASAYELTATDGGWTVNRGKGWAAYSRTAPGTSVSVLGRNDWGDYVYGADVKPAGSSSAGIVFGYLDEQNYEAFLCGGGMLCHVRVRGGNEQTVAQCQSTVNPVGWHRLKIDVAGAVARLYLDNEQKLASAVGEELSGRIGFRSDGDPGAAFDNLVVWFREQPPDTSVVVDQFAKEDTMKGWASPAYSWRRDQPKGTYWHVGEFFGDSRLEVALSSVNSGQATLALHADGATPETGYRLTVSRAKKTATFELLRQKQSVAKVALEVAQPARLTFLQAGGLVAALLDGEPVLSYFDPQPLAGRAVALVPGAGIGVGSAVATSTHLLDDTFGLAPTNWWGARGNWQVTPRWPCDERWTFFGGLETDAPTLWSRHRYEGDVVFEAWVAHYMDNIDDPQIGYSHLGNLNIAICGDGKNLSSGYSFVFAGHEGGKDNQVTRILRGEEVVAETKDVVMIKPMRLNVPWQRHWFHVRGEKRGGQLRMYVDEKLALEHTDPDPLRGGQVACWSYGIGMMIARARCWYERDAGLTEPPTLLLAPEKEGGTWRVDARHLALVSDFERDTNGWSHYEVKEAPEPMVLTRPAEGKGGSRCLKVTTPYSGGDFVVTTSLKPFDPRKLGKLSFDYKADPDVKVNAYLRFGGIQPFYAVLLTSSESVGEKSVELGKVDGAKADGQWHHAEFDLAAALAQQKALAARKDLRVTSLSFAGPRDGFYLRAGFGGNYLGTSFCLDNVRLIAAPGTKVEELKAVAGL